MTKYAVRMLVKDEEFYIGMAIQSVIEHASVFILDTGSNDNTIDIIHSYINKYPGRITYEIETFGSDELEPGDFRFGKGYREVDAQNYVTKRAIQVFKPKYIIALDGDEVVNDRFWQILDQNDFDALGHSTNLPITPFRVSQHPLDMQEWQGIRLFDPHIRVWKPELNMKWELRDPSSNIHCLQRWGTEPKVSITTDHIHFHLHYSFGPKAIYSYLCDTQQTTQNAAKILGVPLDQMYNQKYFEEYFPDWFKNGRFCPKKRLFDNLLWNKLMQFSIPISHPLPLFVTDKWLEWGEPLDA